MHVLASLLSQQGWQAPWLLGTGRELSFVARPTAACGGLPGRDGCGGASGHSPAGGRCCRDCSARIIPGHRAAVGGSRSEADRYRTEARLWRSLAGAGVVPASGAGRFSGTDLANGTRRDFLAGDGADPDSGPTLLALYPVADRGAFL